MTDDDKPTEADLERFLEINGEAYPVLNDYSFVIDGKSFLEGSDERFEKGWAILQERIDDLYMRFTYHRQADQAVLNDSQKEAKALFTLSAFFEQQAVLEQKE